MARKNIRTKARHAIANAAQWSARGVKTVAGEAIGAAAKAATEVVLQKTAEALTTGRSKLTRSAPAIKRAAGNVAKASVNRPARRKRVARRRASVARASTSRRRKKAKAHAR